MQASVGQRYVQAVIEPILIANRQSQGFVVVGLSGVGLH